MATYQEVFEARYASASGLWKLIDKLTGGLARRIDERRALHKLYNLDERILRDMGFDPAEIYAAHEGGIGELPSNRHGE